ncbi:hypothetical protein pb186bvf_013643 [Paramecium bursaria]
MQNGQTAFDCCICYKFANDIVGCHDCGLLYCKACIVGFCTPNPISCISCDKQRIGVLEQTLMEEYVTLQKTQQPQIQTKANQKMEIEIQKIEKQQQTPQKVNYNMGLCKNSILCQGYANPIFKDDKVCSPECLIYLTIETLPLQKIRIAILDIEKRLKFQNSVITPAASFQFDLKGRNIQTSEKAVFLKEDEYSFKTVMASQGFNSGIHYWEIKIDKDTKNEMKIGVSTNKNIDLNTAFSDYPSGFAYYTVGQFRNGSNSNGYKYGVSFKNTGVVGVYLNMNLGQLYFSYEGMNLGKAAEHASLKTGPVFPAVALLHQAGFEYQSLQPPTNFFN